MADLEEGVMLDFMRAGDPKAYTKVLGIIVEQAALRGEGAMFSHVFKVLGEAGEDMTGLWRGVGGRPLIGAAIEGGSTEIFMKVLEQLRRSTRPSAVINAAWGKKGSKHSLAHAAARNGRVPIVKALVEAGADIERRDDLGLRVVHIAAQEGNHTLLKYLVEDQGAEADAMTDRGKTPLHMAAEGGHQACVSGLLLLGASQVLLDAFTQAGESALSLAVGRGHKGVIGQLLKSGANSGLSLTERDFLEGGGVFKGLGIPSCLSKAAQAGSADAVATLLEGRPCDVDRTVPRLGATALHVAAATRGPNGAVIKILIQGGAAVNARISYSGATALYVVATSGGSTNNAAALLEANADPNAVNIMGRSPLHAACSSGDFDKAQLLVDAGAELEAMDYWEGSTPWGVLGERGAWTEEHDQIEFLLQSPASQIPSLDRRRAFQKLCRFNERARRRLRYLVLCHFHPAKMQPEGSDAEAQQPEQDGGGEGGTGDGGAGGAGDGNQQGVSLLIQSVVKLEVPLFQTIAKAIVAFL